MLYVYIVLYYNIFKRGTPFDLFIYLFFLMKMLKCLCLQKCTMLSAVHTKISWLIKNNEEACFDGVNRIILAT